jgi:hypothetical protein
LQLLRLLLSLRLHRLLQLLRHRLLLFRHRSSKRRHRSRLQLRWWKRLPLHQPLRRFRLVA